MHLLQQIKAKCLLYSVHITLVAYLYILKGSFQTVSIKTLEYHTTVCFIGLSNLNVSFNFGLDEWVMMNSIDLYCLATELCISTEVLKVWLPNVCISYHFFFSHLFSSNISVTSPRWTAIDKSKKSCTVSSHFNQSFIKCLKLCFIFSLLHW